MNLLLQPSQALVQNPESFDWIEHVVTGAQHLSLVDDSEIGRLATGIASGDTKCLRRLLGQLLLCLRREMKWLQQLPPTRRGYAKAVLHGREAQRVANAVANCNSNVSDAISSKQVRAAFVFGHSCISCTMQYFFGIKTPSCGNARCCISHLLAPSSA